ncbi:hypothetical protein HD806DRAFT_507570 [Xylariaceae sp. AK1471]|nr:hypothetical protein HD806DRAFT_507570 [Xylariaceae sp. AK1471]
MTPVSTTTLTPATSPATTAFRHRRRGYRHSAGSGTITPGSGYDGLSLLTPSIGLERDFEGVGGWRLDSADLDAGADDEQQWYNLNSRLEIPKQRHHFRSQSGGALMTGPSGSRLISKSGSQTASHSPERLKMTSSPSQSRSRTPTISKHQGFTYQDGYFPLYVGRNSKKL